MPDIKIGGGSILAELEPRTCPIKPGVGGTIVDRMGPGVGNEGLKAGSQPASILHLEALVLGFAVIGAECKDRRVRAARPADLAPDQIAAGRTDIAGGHDVVAVEGVFNGSVPLFDQRQA